MYNTYKMLQSIVTKESNAMSLEELAVCYKGSLTPSFIATAFCKLFPMIQDMSGYYFGLTEQDVASFSMERLDFCLQSFRPSSGAKFSTYYFRVLKNKFREETEALNTDRRRIIFEAESLESLLEQTELEEMGRLEELATHLQDIIDTSNLTNNEITYCELILSGYGSNKDMAQKMGVSVMTLCNMRKSLREKLSFAL